MSKIKVTPAVLAAAEEIVGILRHLVDHPDRFHVSVRPGTYRVAIELVTDPSDVGQVVGRAGHIVGSVRSFLAALSGKHRVQIDFDYVTEEENRLREEQERSTFRKAADHLQSILTCDAHDDEATLRASGVAIPQDGGRPADPHIGVDPAIDPSPSDPPLVIAIPPVL